MYFVLFCFISHPSLVRISKVLCAFSWIHNDSWTLYLKCTFFFFFLCYCALFDFRMEFVEKKKFQIKVQLWHQKCTDFRYKTSCRLKQNKWLLGDIECICKMATDGPIQFSSHLSVSSTPAMCMCVEYIVMPYLSYGFCFAAQNDVENCNFPEELICCVFIFMHGVYQMRDGMSSMLIPFCVILRFICILLFFFVGCLVRFGFGFHSHNSIWDLIMNSESIHRIMGKEMRLC